MKTVVWLISLWFVLTWSSCQKGTNDKQPMNVLFIAVDDLRPELGCYGTPVVQSPNINRLAAKGTVFNRAYCQQALCSPSRTSLMTGLRPDSTCIYDLNTHFRKTIPEVVTLSQHFKKHGYYTRAFGKIYHAQLLDSVSWSEKTIIPNGVEYALETNKILVNQKKKAIEGKVFNTASARYNAIAGPSYECADVPDNTYNGGIVADMAIELLNTEKMKQSPFFLAVGFYKPHLPFVAPKKYWDLYTEEEIPSVSNYFYPVNMPDVAKTDWGELRAYDGIPQKGHLPDSLVHKLKHGYYACVSYTDAQIGRILDELERLNLADNTIVVLWGDHGWKLGEHKMWCKHTNFEIDARAPLICYCPNQKAKGTKTDALVEFIDIYPSLCEMAGLSLPDHLQGTSFVPLLNNPEETIKDVAISQYPRGSKMGYSMRTDHYRFTLWVDKVTKEIDATELYNHINDPEENINVAGENEMLIKEFTKRLMPYIQCQ